MAQQEDLYDVYRMVIGKPATEEELRLTHLQTKKILTEGERMELELLLKRKYKD